MFAKEIGLGKLKKTYSLCAFPHTCFSRTAKEQPNLNLLIYIVYQIVAKSELWVLSLFTL